MLVWTRSLKGQVWHAAITAAEAGCYQIGLRCSTLVTITLPSDSGHLAPRMVTTRAN